MMRSLVFVICIVCVATVLSEIIGLGFLWMRGQLTADTVADVRAALAGTPRQNVDDSDNEKESTAPSLKDVVEERSLRVWDLDRRQKNAAVIFSMVNTRATRLTNTEQDFDKRRQEFLKQLQTMTDTLNSTSTEQARGILEKLQPADAVQYLMAGTLEHNVTLVKGLPDEAVATLLQEFQASPDKANVERGKKIFQAISDGDPNRKILKSGQQQFGAQPQTNPVAMP